MSVTLAIVLPIFAVILLGYGVGKTRLFGDEGVRALSNFCFYVAIPAVLFRAMATLDAAHGFDLAIVAAFYSAVLATYGLAMLTGRVLFAMPLAEQAIFAAGSTALPYLVGRMDICFDNMVAVREKVKERPSELLRRIYYDSVTFTLDALKMAVEVGGTDKILYGSDYPHNIGDMRGCLARVDALPFDQRKAARGANARRIFNI